MIDYRVQPAGWNPGIYDIDYDRYDSIPALRSSDIKKFKKSPLHFKAAMDIPRPQPSLQMQRIFNIGKAYDIIILEGGIDKLMSLSAIEPDEIDGKKVSRNSNAYKDWAQENIGKLILTQDMANTAIAMAMAVQQKQSFAKYFNGKGFPHRVAVWQCPTTGLWCKAEIDYITNEGKLIDLKTTADASFWFFNRNARRLGYFNQAGHYCEGLTILTGYLHEEFFLSAVEKDPYHESIMYRIPPHLIDRARYENDEIKMQIRTCLDNDHWPGYPDVECEFEFGQFDFEEQIDDETEGYLEENGF